MRYYVVLLTLALATWACAEERYSDKYDYVDVHEILTNDKMREQYYNCFIGSSPCATPDAKFFKTHLPEAIATKCKKCTEKQVKMFDAMAEWYTENQPEKWDAVVKKMLESLKPTDADRK